MSVKTLYTVSDATSGVRKWGIHELYMAFKYTPEEFCSMSYAWSETDRTNSDGRSWELGFSGIRTTIVRQGHAGLS